LIIGIWYLAIIKSDKKLRIYFSVDKDIQDCYRHICLKPALCNLIGKDTFFPESGDFTVAYTDQSPFKEYSGAVSCALQ